MVETPPYWLKERKTRTMTRPITAIKIQHDNTRTKEKLKTYKDYQQHLEGLMEAVDMVYFDPAKMANIEFTMWVNEEYLYKFNARDHWNYTAVTVASVSGRPDLMLLGIYGPVLITGPADSRGETTPVPPAIELLVHAAWKLTQADIDEASAIS